MEFESNQMTNDLVIVSKSAKWQAVAILVAILVSIYWTKLIVDLVWKIDNSNTSRL